jgi:4-amino-4-deoxy-L-arabinose transferase-like glycosyltransferase
MAALLVGYALVWSLYGTLAKGSQDLHVDMGEMFAWSNDPGLGTPKHPPLGAWMVWLWFSVLPRTDWSYYLLAMMMPTIALWIAWRLCADYLDTEKRVAGTALLTFIPFMNFHALKYNANTVLIPLWAATTFWFVRSFETRRIIWAALAGMGAAGAMLGKYWSACLVAGLGVAALADSRRADYFSSPAPWVSIAVGTALLAPHIVWLSAHGFVTIGYLGLRDTEPIFTALLSALLFLLGFAAYVAPALIAAFVASLPSWQALRDIVVPSLPQQRLINLVFFGPLAVAAVVATALRVQVTSLWMMPAATLLPIVLLSSSLVVIQRKAAVTLLAAAVIWPVLMVIAAPGIAMAIHLQGVARHAAHYRFLAGALEERWSASTNKPLKILGSDDYLANGILFYMSGRPLVYYVTAPALSPWVNEARIAREGMALVCPVEDRTCVEALNARSAPADVAPMEITLVRQYLGVPGRSARYVVSMIPPQP